MYVLFTYPFYLFISGDRILLGPEFSAPFQNDPGAHPASYTKRTGLFPGLKWLGRGVNHSPLFITEVKERVGFIPLIPLRAFMADYRLN